MIINSYNYIKQYLKNKLDELIVLSNVQSINEIVIEDFLNQIMTETTINIFKENIKEISKSNNSKRESDLLKETKKKNMYNKLILETINKRLSKDAKDRNVSPKEINEIKYKTYLALFGTIGEENNLERVCNYLYRKIYD